MAKSVRSKWKKQQRRERTRDEEENTRKRISQLHGKLRLTVRGGISSVAPQAPEKRFHFLNPELDPRVPNPRKNLNNNYRAELNSVSYDFSKPLRLTPPKTNYYGKSDTTTPHTMTIHYETIDADAPIAGHALTKKDLERLAMKASAGAGLSSQSGHPANECEEEGAGNSARQQSSLRGHHVLSEACPAHMEIQGNEEDDEDSPEEFVFGLEDGVARKVKKGASRRRKRVLAAVGPSLARRRRVQLCKGEERRRVVTLL